MKKITSPTKKKVLLLLHAGLALSLTRSFHKQKYIFRSLVREWKSINRRYLYRIIKEFEQERLIDFKETVDGITKIVLSEKGQKRVLAFDIDNLKIKKPAKWDGIWRLIIYDIPHRRRRVRDTLRYKLKELGFYEWQKSVFVCPFPCRDEIDFVIEFFEIRPYVRYAELSNPTNEAELKLHFNLV